MSEYCLQQYTNSIYDTISSHSLLSLIITDGKTMTLSPNYEIRYAEKVLECSHLNYALSKSNFEGKVK